MATSPETFNQVRDILRKLDRSIDNARNRRLAGREGDAPDQPTPEGEDAAPRRARPMRPRPEGDPPPDQWIGQPER
jgi:hypothetical protein